ncbi:MAG: dTDP-4-dehydrorhamnose 3,5-epimerase [Oleiphilaceae bacterium]|jgi:dTDP-4-dehydrorhamnose 3,5-epimerase
MIDGVILTPLKRIATDNGDVFHGMKISEPTYYGFGEAYFSTVSKNAIKGWKKHTKMNMNLMVPNGCIQFVIFDDRELSPTYNSFYSIKLSPENYYRLTIPAGLWVAFRGIAISGNLLMNFSDIMHDPDESLTTDISNIPYEWDNNE